MKTWTKFHTIEKTLHWCIKIEKVLGGIFVGLIPYSRLTESRSETSLALMPLVVEESDQCPLDATHGVSSRLLSMGHTY